jgi:hypothetical protein
VAAVVKPRTGLLLRTIASAPIKAMQVERLDGQFHRAETRVPEPEFNFGIEPQHVSKTIDLLAFDAECFDATDTIKKYVPRVLAHLHFHFVHWHELSSTQATDEEHPAKNTSHLQWWVKALLI